MSWRENEKNKSFNCLREDYIRSQREMKHYRFLYKSECQKNKVLQSQIIELRNKCNEHEFNVQQLRRKLRNVNNLDKTLPVTRKRKAWCKITCERTKRQRISQYSDFVFSTIKDNVPQCRRAQLCLCLGDKMVNYSWKSKHFRMNNFNTKTKSLVEIEHSYATKPVDKDAEEDEDFINVDYREIFDSEGNWQPNHKQRIINVMDSYRISHKAYHELRHTGKGHFPPLHHIMKEKNLMSDVLTFIKHPTVS